MRRAATILPFLFGALLSMAVCGPAHAAARLTAVAPLRAGDRLVCRLETHGLPDEKQLQSMRSGLVASIDLHLAVIDADGSVLGGQSLTLRLGFDLWEEIYSVTGLGSERRFRTLGEMQAHLADLRGLPLASFGALAESDRYRVRVGLVAHPVARDERERVGNLIAGEPRGEPARQDQQEASVSLGRLIRFFYQGARSDRDGQELMSDWFRRQEVADETH